MKRSVDRGASGWVLAASVVGISFAGPLTRLSHADSAAIAAGRLAMSLVAIAIVVVVTGQWREWRQLRPGEWITALGAGVLLALHFWSWNASIHLTTIAASTTLVTASQPLLIAILSVIALREIPTRGQGVGIALATLGAITIAAPDLFQSSAIARSGLGGDALAVCAGAAGASYMIIGRKLRARLGAWSYVALVYGSALVTLLAIAGVTGAHVAPQPPRELALFAGLAVGPMLLGHTGMNWALEHLPAYVVNLTVLCEPIGATLIGMLLPGIHEVPGWATVAGGAIVIAGIAVTVWSSRAREMPLVPA